MHKKKAKKNGASKNKPARESPKKQWCFTCNNPQITKEQLLEALQHLCSYIVIGDEIAPTGTPHFQGYLELVNKQRFGPLKGSFPPTATPHLEPKSKFSTRYQAAQYCKKDAKYVEFGNPPKDNKAKGENSKLKAITDKMQEGIPLSDAILEDAPTFVQNWRGLQELDGHLARKRVPNKRDVQIELHYGKTGTGKTHYAFTKFPDLFKKPIGNALWFDGYNAESVVLIDEFTGQYPLSSVLQLLDCWKTQVEVKGGHRVLAATTILLTTNIHPSQFYKSKNEIPWEGREELRHAFNRRITKIYWYREKDDIVIIDQKPEIEGFLMQDIK